MTTTPVNATRGRLCLASAAILWSTSGAFTKLLTKDTGLGLEVPQLQPLTIAFFRALVVAMVFAPFVRHRQLTCRPMMLFTMLAFAVMNASFVSALALGTAANAIVLQYTAPTWMFLASVFFLHEKADRLSLITVGFSLAGIAVIVGGPLAMGETWSNHDLFVVGIALLSGLAYAAVLIGLRVLRNVPSYWLTLLNHLTSAVVLLPFVIMYPMPSGPQLVVLLFYGGLQMGLPYWLAARGMRSVSPQEAGGITLLEPLLNPVWAWMIAGELPKTFEVIGGVLILGALVGRYAVQFARIRRRAQEPEA